MRRLSWMAVLTTLVVLVSADARAVPSYEEALRETIGKASRQYHPGEPLRANIRAEIHGLEGETEDQLVLISRENPEQPGQRQIYLEFRKAGVRLLILGDRKAWIRNTDGETTEASPGSRVGPTSWAVEDFFPYSERRCGTARIADATTRDITFTCEPPAETGTAYSLVVYKMNRQTGSAERVMYYKETLNNLVKVRQHKDFVDVGALRRPSRIEMRDFQLRTHDVFRVNWTVGAEIPDGLFDPEALGRESPVTWPE